MKQIEDSILKEILEQSLAGYWDWDIPSGDEFLSPSFKKMLGYEDYEIPNRADSWQKLIHPEDLPIVLDSFKRHVESKGAVEYRNEVRYRHKNGSTVWVICTGKVIEWSPDGQPLRMIGCHVDITTQKSFEKRLRESEVHFQELFEKAPLGYQSLDSEGRFLEVNTAWLHTLGYTREEVIGHWFGEFLAPEYVNAFRERFPLFKAQGHIHSEFFMIHKNGERRYIAFDGRIAHKSDGSFKQTHCILKDETERKQLQDALAQELEKTKSILLSIPSGLFIYRFEQPDRLFLEFANNEADKLTGIKGEEWIGREFNEIWPNAKSTGITDRYLEVIRTGTNIELEDIQYQDEHVNGAFRIRAFNILGSRLGVAFENITKAKVAEEALKNSEEKYRTIVENIMDSLYIHDFKGIIQDCNEAACLMSGYSRDELIGSSLAILDSPEDKIQLPGRMERLMRDDIIVFEAKHIRKDGKFMAVEVCAKVVSRERDGIVHGFVRDITDRKRTEESLMNAQKIESLGILAGGIAHDFNNLLAGLFINIELAVEENKNNSVAEHLTKVQGIIGRAKSLTRQLLTFAKGGSPIRKLSHLPSLLKQSVQFALSGSNCLAKTEIPEDLWPAEIDEDQIGQALDNIIINAKQAMPQGGEISVVARNLRLTDHILLPAGSYVKISIQDTGCGIAEENLQKIFDPFFSTKPQGHGLGLSTCYSIIKRHNGHVDVESIIGRGTHFHIFLPASPDKTVVANSSPKRVYSNSGTIILMDDEREIRGTVSRILNKSGFTVLEASNGDELLELYHSSQAEGKTVSGIICDLTVPGGKGGKEIIPLIRAKDKTLPVFVASGYADDPVMAEPEKFGFTASLGKPFSLKDLLELLSKHIPAGKG